MIDDNNDLPPGDENKEVNKNTTAGEDDKQEENIELKNDIPEEDIELRNDIPEEDIIVTETTDSPTKEQPSANTKINDDTGKQFNATCRCFKKANGKYYCYEMQKGNWVQVSIIPFDTQEECEGACC